MIRSSYSRNSLGRLRQMRAPEARFVLDQRGVFAASELGETLIPWDRITEVWQRPESWMIFFGPSQFITMPIREIPEEALGYLRRNLPRG
ncbi:YcxB family protein [Paracoccus xiamenensis]|uniref:YcxB family protein n=1 Tax=Paracoccus xiamenensis TaxID=2714901 RepID=UPI001407B4D5|nr:YcxB family protein [Paracoccus xiamenensis]NHF74210.1 YcxB family protein [Paracoccus xiamenensis]